MALAWAADDASQHKLNELYLQWWSLPETEQLATSLLTRLRHNPESLQGWSDDPGRRLQCEGGASATEVYSICTASPVPPEAPTPSLSPASPPSTGSSTCSPQRMQLPVRSPTRSPPRTPPKSRLVFSDSVSPSRCLSSDSMACTSFPAAAPSATSSSPAAVPVAIARNVQSDDSSLVDMEIADPTSKALSPVDTESEGAFKMDSGAGDGGDAVSPRWGAESRPRQAMDWVTGRDGITFRQHEEGLEQSQSSPKRSSSDALEKGRCCRCCGYDVCETQGKGSAAPGEHGCKMCARDHGVGGGGNGKQQEHPAKRLSVQRLPNFYEPPNSSARAHVRQAQSRELRELLERRGIETVKLETLRQLLPLLPESPLPPQLCRALLAQFATPSRTIPGAAECPAVAHVVSAERFLRFFDEHMAGAGEATRLHVCLSGSSLAPLTQQDFSLLLEEVMETHPALQLLKDRPDFKELYQCTVVLRIFHQLDPLRSLKVARMQLNRSASSLLSALWALEGEAATDINAELRFFSYEHFYVIYCKWVELDSEGRQELSLQNLLCYGEGALTLRTAERVFDARVEETEHGGMSYSDFVFFILCEENKKSSTACGYWFRILDLDGDGLISLHDVRHFYEDHRLRLHQLGQPPVSFSDLMAQLIDAVKPLMASGRRSTSDTPDDCISCAELRRSGQCELFTNSLCNVHKFLQIEAQDVGIIKEQLLTPHLSPWDRWASSEFLRMLMDDEAEEEEEATGYEALDFSSCISEWGGSTSNMRLGVSGASESPF